MQDDLLPSGSDERTVVLPGSTGSSTNQNAPDFSISTTLGTTFTLSTNIASHRGVVLYFMMWGCPTCDSHLSYIRTSVLPSHPDVLFCAVDYVSGTVADSRGQEVANGYDGSGITFLADTSQTALNLYSGTMATTVVIDKNGVVQMNEDMKDGSKLLSTLAALP